MIEVDTSKINPGLPFGVWVLWYTFKVIHPLKLKLLSRIFKIYMRPIHHYSIYCQNIREMLDSGPFLAFNSKKVLVLIYSRILHVLQFQSDLFTSQVIVCYLENACFWPPFWPLISKMFKS